MNNGLLIVGGAIALWLYSKAHAGMNLQFVPLGASWEGGGLHVTIGVQNPTDTPLQFNSLAAQITINGTPAGNVSSFSPTMIAANAQTPVEAVFRPDYLGTAFVILNQIQGGIGGITIQMKGTASVNGVGLPIDITFQLMAS